MSIYNNAIISIKMGLEDFQVNDDERIISATRNLYSGILLLIKAKLSHLSPPDSNSVLIKRRVVPHKNKDGEIRFIGKGNETVNRRELQERCNELDVRVDWKKLDKVAKYRNDIEHFFSERTPASAKKVLSDCFIIIRDFLKDELCKDPISELGSDLWTFLLEKHDVFSRELEVCQKALSNLHFESQTAKEAFEVFECGSCGGALISPVKVEPDIRDVSFVCQACGQTYYYEEALEIALESKFWYEEYAVHSEGGEPPVADCPGCGIHSYVIEEGKCLACGESYPSECQVCGGCLIGTNNLNEVGICDYCALKL